MRPFANHLRRLREASGIPSCPDPPPPPPPVKRPDLNSAAASIREFTRRAQALGIAMDGEAPKPYPCEVRAAKGWKLLSYNIPANGAAEAKIQKGKVICDVIMTKKDGVFEAAPDLVRCQYQPWELEPGMKAEQLPDAKRRFHKLAGDAGITSYTDTGFPNPPAFVITHPGSLTEQTHKHLCEAWAEIGGGAKLMILEEGMKIEALLGTATINEQRKAAGLGRIEVPGDTVQTRGGFLVHPDFVEAIKDGPTKKQPDRPLRARIKASKDRPADDKRTAWRHVWRLIAWGTTIIGSGIVAWLASYL